VNTRLISVTPVGRLYLLVCYGLLVVTALTMTINKAPTIAYLLACAPVSLLERLISDVDPSGTLDFLLLLFAPLLNYYAWKFVRAAWLRSRQPRGKAA